MDQLVEVLKALADPVRLRVLALLDREELCVCELVAALDMTQPAVSQHLAKLKEAGLVRDRRHGQWIFYRFAPDGEYAELARTAVGGVGTLETEWARLATLSSDMAQRRCSLASRPER